jgi:hypothetical protein
MRGMILYNSMHCKAQEGTRNEVSIPVTQKIDLGLVMVAAILWWETSVMHKLG